jgi:ParB/RepB/Spo0J family partition protein
MATAVQPQLQYIPIDKIKAASNIRTKLGDLDDLTLSIQTFGVIQPLAVRPENGGYVVIAGHRRLAASEQAGLKDVPCLVREDLADAPLLMAQLIENLQRVDLDPLEEGHGFKQLLGLGLKQKEIAGKVGRSEAHISKRLSLLDLPEAVTMHVAAGTMALGDALDLAAYADEPEVIKKVVANFEDSQKRGFYFNPKNAAGQAKREFLQERERAAATAKLKAAGVKVLEHKESYGTPRNATALGHGYAALPMKVEDHAKSPCHVAWLDWNNAVHYGCSKVANHKDSTDKAVAKSAKAIVAGNPTYSTRKSETFSKAQKERQEREAAFKKLQPVRMAALKRALTAKQPREQVLDFTLRQLLESAIGGMYDSGGADALAAELLAVPTTKVKYGRQIGWGKWLSAGNDRVFKLAYAVALASGETTMRDLARGGAESVATAARYIEHLKKHGYKPDPLELEQLTAEGAGIEPAWDAVDKPKAKKK